MPQLMPFYWVDSVFMVLYIIVTLVFFYCFKNVENMNDLNFYSKKIVLYNMMW